MKRKITIGKHTLESLTTGMYKDPFIVYREYIQNSLDALDIAIAKGIVDKEQANIIINIDADDNKIIIEDNGIGISEEKAYRILTDIGNSKKKMASNRGFRGIGRLGGLSYCEKLTFETSYYGEKTKTRISFDAIKLNELLIPGKYEEYDIMDVVDKIVTLNKEEEESKKHYFKVILENVTHRLKLTDMEKVENYLIQVAPVPFDMNKFDIAQKLYDKFIEFNINENSYNIYLKSTDGESKKLYKPYKTKFYAGLDKKIIDNINDIEIKLITNDYDNKLIGLVWYGKCNLLATLGEPLVKGLRMRKSGILVGDRFSLSNLFKEDRFNGWVQGEVIILDDEIIPNARRDDFEKNDAYKFLLDQLKTIAEEISMKIRNASKERNKKKNVNNKATVNKEKEIGKEELIKKVDLLIDQVNVNNEKTLKSIYEIIKSELDKKSANSLIDKIKKNVV